MEYSLTLEKYTGIKSRFTCPGCNSKHQFARYIDGAGNYIADHVGRCNRESKCGYHLKPKEYFENNPTTASHPAPAQIKQDPPRPTQYIHQEVVLSTLKAYEQNTFVKFLHTIFDEVTVRSLVDAYGLGTTKDGSCIFWQVDTKRQVRTGKVIRYQEDGHRDKSQPPYFIHTRLKVEPIEQCLFGLHLLMVDDTRPIGLVESEKTAVIMAGQLPDYTWMATGGKTNLSKVDALKGKKVLCFPDTDAFQVWSERLTPYGFKISNALQRHVNDPDNGYDLADFVPPQRILGELIKRGQENGEIKTQATAKSSTRAELDDYGLNKKQSSAFQHIADIPEETFEDFIEEKKAENYLETLKDGRVIEMHPAGYPLSWAV